jgi:3-deoxy-D-manno-octulosonate 8-phosphate phosphatase (KDO 8-P phosphatase)
MSGFFRRRSSKKGTDGQDAETEDTAKLGRVNYADDDAVDDGGDDDEKTQLSLKPRLPQGNLPPLDAFADDGDDEKTQLSRPISQPAASARRPSSFANERSDALGSDSLYARLMQEGLARPERGAPLPPMPVVEEDEDEDDDFEEIAEESDDALLADDGGQDHDAESLIPTAPLPQSRASDMDEAEVDEALGDEEAALQQKARDIDLLVFDVDGVLTDGGLYYGPQGEALKRFNVQDGHGINLALRAGLRVALLTARSSQIVDYRAKELGIETVLQGRKDKVAGLEALLAEIGVGEHQVAYMGDDLIDLGPLTRARLSACPADACPEVCARVDVVVSSAGGHGAVREFIEFVLKAQGKWDALVEDAMAAV